MKSDAEELLRSKGLRATPKRKALLNALSAPATVENLHQKVPSADLVTVYRTMRDFVAVGLAREVRFKDASIRFESAKDHHHHLVCTTCGVIAEVPECSVSSLEKRALKASKQFVSVEEHTLEFFGTCIACA
jgi:Fe2+ or Zn2+ uptake regulation protein